MNLPVDAVEFLDCFIGIFNKADKLIWLRPGETEIQLPLIHVYGFAFEKEEKNKALAFFVERIGKAMNYPEFSAEMVIDFHNIRDVSPQSRMYSTTFRLPAAVAFAKENNARFIDVVEVNKTSTVNTSLYEEFKGEAEPNKRQKLN